MHPGVDSLIAATVNWEIRSIAKEEEFTDHLRELVAEAAARTATVVVLPELIVLELLALKPDLPEAEGPAWLAGSSDELEQEIARLASSFGITLIGGSHFSEGLDGLYNVSAVADAEGVLKYQPKNNLTRYEEEVWNVRAHAGLNRMHDPRIGVTICYDSEFPEAGRILAESGVLVHCVPAYTETEHGFYRVRNSCLARAIENQVYIVHASLVGNLGREPVATTYGSSAVLAPSVPPFEATGVLAETELNKEGIAVADCNPHTLLAAREAGDVRNWTDRKRSDYRLG